MPQHRKVLGGLCTSLLSFKPNIDKMAEAGNEIVTAQPPDVPERYIAATFEFAYLG